MRFHSEARRDAYDAVVIGAGMGGLTAAALLGRAGRRVLVVERHDRVGGYAHAFRRGRRLFDSAVHLVGGCGPPAFEGGGVVHQVLEALGLGDRLEFVRVDPCYEVSYPGKTLSAPGDLEEFTRVLSDAFPDDAKGLRQFLSECLAVRKETRRAAELESPFDVMRTPDRFPTLLRYRRATVRDLLDECVASRRLRALLGTLWPYVGLPPSRASFPYYATMLMSYLADGAFYCKGSFQRLADALADSIEQSGGEVLLRSAVRRIPVENGRAAGVVLENGQRISADVVVSNADVRQTVDELVGTEPFPPRYLASVRRVKPSLSAFVVYAATSLDLRKLCVQHETFLYSSWDHDAAYRDALAAKPSWLTVTAPTLADPGLAPPGEHLLVLTTLVPYEPAAAWRSRKDAMVDRLLELAERRLPGLRPHLRFAEGATPRTMERYTRNSAGSIYGAELSPAQVGPGRPGIATPVRDLYLVGHWTQPGGGVYGVVSSGIQAARAVLGRTREAGLWRELSQEGGS